MINAVNASKILIHHPCPQCGAPVTLEDTDRIFQCRYCRVRLVVRSSPHATYVLPPSESYLGRPLIHIPYWRFRGMVFALDVSDVAHRILDTSAAAFPFAGLPTSLGVRPQAVRVTFYGPEIPGTFLHPSVSVKDFLKSLGSGLRGRLTAPLSKIAYHAFIGENVSLFYTPCFEQGGQLHDALTGQALCPKPEGIPWEGEERKPTYGLSFLPTLCPQCGGDMDGERDALVLRCRTCSQFWETSASGFQRLEAVWGPGPGGESVGIPFWMLDVACEGFSLETYGDFATLTRLPRHVPPAEAARPFRFWVPAFRVAPRFFLRLALAATIGQNQDPEAAEVPFGRLYPATLTSVEAFQACPVLLGASSPAKDELFPKIRKGRLAFRGKKLAYLSLRHLGSEWVLEPFGVALPLNALRWGRSL